MTHSLTTLRFMPIWIVHDLCTALGQLLMHEVTKEQTDQQRYFFILPVPRVPHLIAVLCRRPFTHHPIYDL